MARNSRKILLKMAIPRHLLAMNMWALLLENISQQL